MCSAACLVDAVLHARQLAVEALSPRVNELRKIEMRKESDINRLDLEINRLQHESFINQVLFCISCILKFLPDCDTLFYPRVPRSLRAANDQAKLPRAD